MAAALAAFLCAMMGQPVQAQRWPEMVDRWQAGDPARPVDPSAEA